MLSVAKGCKSPGLAVAALFFDAARLLQLPQSFSGS